MPYMTSNTDLVIEFILDIALQWNVGSVVQT